MDKVYWFTWGNPDERFFKYGKGKPSDTWCMFKTELAAYRHAYRVILEDQLDEDEVLPSDSSLEDCKKLLKEYGFNLEDRFDDASIIEIPIWE